jgi:hypothetical protein
LQVKSNSSILSAKIIEKNIVPWQVKKSILKYGQSANPSNRSLPDELGHVVVPEDDDDRQDDEDAEAGAEVLDQVEGHRVH